MKERRETGMSQGNKNKEGELEDYSKVRNVNLGKVRTWNRVDIQDQQTMVGSF